MNGRQDMLRSQGMPHLSQQNMLNANPQFLPNQQHSPPQPQPSHMGILPNPPQHMGLAPGTHSPGSDQFRLQVQRAQQDQYRRNMAMQAQQATTGGAQGGGPSGTNGISPAQMSVQNAGFPNGMQQPRRVASHPGPGHPMSGLSQAPPGMGVGMGGGMQGGTGLGINMSGSMPSQMRSNPQQPPPMNMRQGPPPQQHNMGGQLSPAIALTRPGNGQGMVRNPGVPAGMMGSMPGQLHGQTHGGGMQPGLSQNPFQPSLSQQSLASSPSQGSISQNPFQPASSGLPLMQTVVDRARGNGMTPEFFGGQFSQVIHHPPPNRTPSNNPNQFAFSPSSSTPPNQHVDLSQGHPGGGPTNGPPGPSHRAGFTSVVTPAQQFEQMQPGGGISGGNLPDGFTPQFGMPPPRPPSSQHPSLGHPPQQQHQPSHPPTPHQLAQPPHQSPQHQHDQVNGHGPHPARPLSQPQPPGRPPSQQAGPSRTPLPQNASLPANATLLRPTSISMPPHQTLSHSGMQPSTPLGLPGGPQTGLGPPVMQSQMGGRVVGPQQVGSAASEAAMGRMPPGPAVGPVGPMLAGRPVQPAPPVGLGQALGRLLQFSGVLASEHSKKLQLSYWEELVKEYFLPSSSLKLTLWKDNQKNEAKIFEVGTPILPRFFLVTSQSGVKSMTMSLDGARERVFAQNHAIVECVSAVWTYRYINGYTVTLRGPLTAHILVIPTQPASGASAQSASHPGYSLKINHLQFDSNMYEKHISLDFILGQRVDSPKTPRQRNAQTPTLNGVTTAQQKADEEKWDEPRIVYDRASIPSEPVNAFGIPQATMRCLELAESVGQMTDLIQYSNSTHFGPLESLKLFAQQIRESPSHNPQGLSPNGTNAPGLYTADGIMVNGGVPQNSAAHTLYPPNPMPSNAPGPSSGQQPGPPPSQQQSSAPSNSATSPGKSKGTPQQAHAPNPASGPSSSSQPSNPSSTPSLSNATLKRKAQSSEISSPTTATAEQPPAPKRNPRKRGRTQGGS